MKQHDKVPRRLLIAAKVLLSFALVCALCASSLVAMAEEPAADAQSSRVITANGSSVDSTNPADRGGIADANAEQQVIRVAYWAMGDYFTLDAAGQIDSFDRAYLDEVAKYTDYRFEYVDCGSWNNALAMLRNKEVDLVGTMQYDPDRALTYEMCDTKYGITYATIAAESTSSFVYEDYSSLADATIGLTTGYVREADTLELFAEHGINPTLVYYPDQSSLSEALDSGEVDAIATNSHTYESGWKVLDRYAYQPFYFASWKGNTELIDNLNAAILSIDLYESGFLTDTLRTYFPSIVNAPFSKAELDYIAEAEPITLYLEPDTSPLAFLNEKTGNMEGILVDLIGLVANRSGLTLNVEPMPDDSFSPGENEYLFTLFPSGSVQNVDESDVVITDSLLDGNYYYYASLGSTYDMSTDASYTVAIPENRAAFQDFFEKTYPNYTFVEYNGPVKCIEAVQNGEADLAFLNSYCADSILVTESINDIVNVPTSGRSFGIGFAITGDDASILSSILDKGIANIEEQERQAIIVSYSLGVVPDASFGYFVKHNLMSFILLGVAALALILLLVIWVMRFRVMRKQKIELDHVNEELAKANAAKTEFLSRMSHDMRTPMNAIIGLTAIAQSETDDQVAMREYLDQIDNSSNFLLGLINDVLDMARIEDGAIVLHLEPHDINDFIGQIDTLIRPLCDEKNIELNVVKENCDNPVVFHDILRFNQIFFNLLSNAVKYTPDGGKIDLVISQLSRDGDTVRTRFIVRDNGIGMSEEFQKHMFDPFTREDESHVSSGGSTGLGLAITKNLVDIMGGTMNVRSSTGRGTEYCIELEATVARKPSRDAQPASETDGVSLEGRTVLLCEDHPLNAQIVVKLLEREGVEVICATNGQEGVSLFESLPAQTLDAVLMDVRMPVMDGLEAARAIRSLDRIDAKTVPIIALTANAYLDDVRRTQEAGMNAHIAKPFQIEELLSILKHWIGISENGAQ